MREPKAGKVEEDRLDVKLVAIGHGDAILLHWAPAGQEPSTILIDGGPGGSAGASLREALSEVEAKKISLLVLTHTDADHVDGLVQYAESTNRLPIEEYRGPCLPAFQRFEWLFPPRVKRGLEQAARLETLLGPATTQLYPVESAYWSSPDGGLEVTVLSPAARLVERLLLADDAADLFDGEVMPLSWLLQPAAPPDVEDIYEDVRAALSSGYLAPDRVRAAPAPEPLQETARGFRQTSADPEFFGNNVLNDTSIVLLVEARTGRTTKRLLLTGDLENFTYLAARHPLGLNCDVVKAPHHGSWSYLDRGDKALDEVWQWLRPKAVLVSGRGKHGLPRAEFRDAVLRWGSTLFCTCRRAKELVVGHQPTGSCHDQFGCGGRPQETVTLTLREAEISAQGVACGAGALTGTMPIIQVRQHVIDPSAILDRFTERELARHVGWVVNQLRDLHRARREAGAEHDENIQAISSTVLCRQALAVKQYPAVPNIDLILDRAVAKGLIWSPAQRWRNENRESYILPSDADWKDLKAWIGGFLAIQFRMPDAKVPRTTLELLAAVDHTYLSKRASILFGFPAAMFADAIWGRLARHLLERSMLAISAERYYGPYLLLHRDLNAQGLSLALNEDSLDDISDFLTRLMRWDRYSRSDAPSWPEALKDLLAPPWSGDAPDLGGLRELGSRRNFYHDVSPRTALAMFADWPVHASTPFSASLTSE